VRLDRLKWNDPWRRFASIGHTRSSGIAAVLRSLARLRSQRS
jgi:hypothetical protein